MATEYYRVKHLRGTLAQWQANNLTPAEGEIVIELSTTSASLIKIGDGVRSYAQLPYASAIDLEARALIQTLQGQVSQIAATVANTAATVIAIDGRVTALETLIGTKISWPVAPLAPGAVLWFDGAAWQASGAGSPGEVLTSGGSGAPSWRTANAIFDYQGSYTPGSGINEYPSTSPAANQAWSLETGITWTTGDLVGVTGEAGDLVVWTGTSWALVPLGADTAIDMGTFTAPTGSKVAQLRSDTAGAVPTPALALEGALAINRADRQLFGVASSGVAKPYLAVRLYDTTAQYVADDYAVFQGQLFRAVAPSLAGQWTPANWRPVNAAFITANGAAPTTAFKAGDLWFDTGTRKLSLAYDAGGGSIQWLEVAGSSSSGSGGGVVGDVSPFIGAIPSGYIELAGQTVFAIDWPELVEYLNPGGVSAVLPDWRGRFVAGVGATTDARGETYSIAAGETGGERRHVLTVGELAAHAHQIGRALNADNGSARFSSGSPGEGNLAGTTTVGSDLPHNNMPPYAAARWAIRASSLVVTGTGAVAIVPHIFSSYHDGVLAAGARLLRVPVVSTFTLPEEAPGSRCECLIAPTADATISIAKNATVVATATILAGETVGTIECLADATWTEGAGDVLDVTGPAVADATLAGVSISLKFIRSETIP